LLRIAAGGGVCLWLQGHRHDPYHLAEADLAPFPVICAGSATQSGHWSYGEYTIRGARLHGQQRLYDPDKGGFRDGQTFELDLPHPNTNTQVA
jgi:hypothetical protein